MLYYKHAKGGYKMTIKNKMVTREQYDKLQSKLTTAEGDYDLVRRHGIEYANWSRARMKDMQPKRVAKVAWILVTVLAVLSSAQSITLFFFC